MQRWHWYLPQSSPSDILFLLFPDHAGYGRPGLRSGRRVMTVAAASVLHSDGHSPMPSRRLHDAAVPRFGRGDHPGSRTLCGRRAPTDLLGPCCQHLGSDAGVGLALCPTPSFSSCSSSQLGTRGLPWVLSGSGEETQWACLVGFWIQGAEAVLAPLSKASAIQIGKDPRGIGKSGATIQDVGGVSALNGP